MVSVINFLHSLLYWLNTSFIIVAQEQLQTCSTNIAGITTLQLQRIRPTEDQIKNVYSSSHLVKRKNLMVVALE